jgi:hypothetical protein
VGGGIDLPGLYALGVRWARSTLRRNDAGFKNDPWWRQFETGTGTVTRLVEFIRDH